MIAATMVRPVQRDWHAELLAQAHEAQQDEDLKAEVRVLLVKHKPTYQGLALRPAVYLRASGYNAALAALRQYERGVAWSQDGYNTADQVREHIARVKRG